MLIIKRIIAALLALLALLTPAFAKAPSTSAGSAILVSEDGRVLYEKNADSKALIASTTKIMTALIVLESCPPDEVVIVSALAASTEGSSMRLRAGERISVGDLLYGLLLVSGNDAAVALAQHTAGSIESFARRMNAKAAELGLQNSAFKNPHGLDCEGHYSTARDMARLASEAMKNEDFRRIASTRTATAAGRSLVNHNKLLWNCEGVIGLKTGYTEAAGRTLVSAAERGGRTLICVTLGDPDDWRDHASLYDWGFASSRTVVYAQKDSEYLRLPVVSGEETTVGVVPVEDCNLSLLEGEDAELTVKLPQFVYAPVRAGESAGRIEVRIGGRIIKTAELIYAGTVERDDSQRLNFFEKLVRRLGV